MSLLGLILGLIALERMTWTQGMITLGPPIANNKDKAFLVLKRNKNIRSYL